MKQRTLISLALLKLLQHESHAIQSPRSLNKAFVNHVVDDRQPNSFGLFQSNTLLSLRGGASASSVLLDEDETDDEDESEDDSEEEEEEEESDDDEEDSSPSSSSPVKVILSTSNSPNKLIDQSIELTASPSRTVASLKQSVSRQFKSKPPMEAVILRLDGVVLDDDEVVSDLIEEHDDEDDEDEDDDDGEEDLPKLKIHVDMLPPVDPKFGTEFKECMDSMTNQEILDAYVTNAAAMHHNSMDLLKDDSSSSVDEDSDDEDESDDEEEESLTSTTSTNLSMQKYALSLKEQIVSSLSSDQNELLNKSENKDVSEDGEDIMGMSQGDVSLKESIKRKKRKGGAKMNVKRALQKNMNINWPDTIRNFLLFIFFGYFGGRNATSRTIMLLGAPACFITQARPVKVCMKQLFYAIGQPPGLFLSLLPAPQQAIMSCDYDQLLKGLYGDEVGLNNDLISGVEEQSGEGSEDESEYDGESDEDEYDGEYDDEYDDE